MITMNKRCERVMGRAIIISIPVYILPYGLPYSLSVSSILFLLSIIRLLLDPFNRALVFSAACRSVDCFDGSGRERDDVT